MPKFWVKNYFAHGSFPEVGQKQKTEKKRKKEERLNDGDNNGQATHGARKHAWHTRAAWAKKVGENNGQLRFVRHHVRGTQARLDQQLDCDINNAPFQCPAINCGAWSHLNLGKTCRQSRSSTKDLHKFSPIWDYMQRNLSNNCLTE